MDQLAWVFLGKTLHDGRPVPSYGERIDYDGPMIEGTTGLWASLRPSDALLHAQGPVLHLVKCRYYVPRNFSRFASRQQMFLAREDFSDPVRDFLRAEALDVADQWDAPKIVLEWLRTGDRSLQEAARKAAYIWEMYPHPAALLAAFSAMPKVIPTVAAPLPEPMAGRFDKFVQETFRLTHPVGVANG